MTMNQPKKYKVVISKDTLLDIKSIKKYILDTFKYRDYAENFSNRIKKAIRELNSFPKGYESICYVIEELNKKSKSKNFYFIQVFNSW